MPGGGDKEPAVPILGERPAEPMDALPIGTWWVPVLDGWGIWNRDVMGGPTPGT